MILLPNRNIWTNDNLPDRAIELDPTFPYFHNLKSAYYFHDKRRGYDLVRKAQASIDGAPTLTSGRHGWHEQFDGSDDAYDTGFDPTDTSFTSICLCRGRTVPGSSKYAAVVSHGDHFSFYWHHVDSSRLRGAFLMGDGGSYPAISLGTLSAETWYCFGGKFDGSTMEAYTNGVSQGTELASYDHFTQNIYLGREAGGAYFWDGDIAVFLYFDTALPDALIFDISQNPFILLRQPRRWTLGFVPAETLKTIAESGAGSDGLADLSVAMSLADAGSGSDTPGELSASMLLGDLAGGADGIDILSVLAQLADSGLGSDAIAGMLAALDVSETGSCSDSASITVTVSVSDSGAGGDAVSVLTDIIKQINEVAGGADSISGIEVQTVVADAGAGADSPSVSAAITVSDAGAGAEAINVIQAALKSISDIGGGADSLGPVTVSLSVSDPGDGADSIGLISALLSLPDAVGGSDVAVAFDSEIRIASISFALTKRSMTFIFSKRTINMTLQ